MQSVPVVAAVVVAAVAIVAVVAVAVTVVVAVVAVAVAVVAAVAVAVETTLAVVELTLHRQIQYSHRSKIAASMIASCSLSNDRASRSCDTKLIRSASDIASPPDLSFPSPKTRIKAPRMPTICREAASAES